jgi:endonuclease/exonuclease/phosphatase family metal-dependent hydrolase
MLLLCWNLAGRLKRMGEQADLVAGLGADVVCLQELTPGTASSWAERLAAARLPALGGLEVVNVHSPISPKPQLAKVRTHEAVFRHLGAAAGHPRLVCGDHNTPRREHADGSVWTTATSAKRSPGSGGAGAAATGWTTSWCRRRSRSSGATTCTSGGRS